ncbi:MULTISPECIES: H-NS family nucleoid-associated regulatory protein [Aeromonas]|uniref:DNA-binding protein n=1 Tax=Aeromonas caviae TaxID=648 RepID=A0AA42VFC8_AERCA|nr:MULTISPECIES: H-NS family nucleoid-associated regulatory protein [Aeromonas]MBP4059441.1 H-NS histone family protein [Aeromonas sp. Prich7-2]MCW4617907.1 H-NS histone family protein [Aeromonas hydrophila]MDH0309633.1 H-NS histone family protein [Aeromonas caviae]MDH0319799.1 H-NS histone family protein [Aeromonas caviae]MDH0361142.1 H-NS histone family protein [Aeromonas caviae]
MQEFFKTLLNIRSLRAALRDLPFEQVQEAHEKFELVYLERKTQADKEIAAQSERKSKLAEFQELLAQAGIDPKELLGDTAGVDTSSKKKRTPRPPKYRYVVDGIEQTWTGQGRTPKYLAEEIAKGRSLDDFLI